MTVINIGQMLTTNNFNKNIRSDQKQSDGFIRKSAALKSEKVLKKKMITNRP